MTEEGYKLIQKYRRSFVHDRTGRRIDYSARVLRDPHGGILIEHSHAPIPTEGAGPWFSNSASEPLDLQDIEPTVQFWLREHRNSYDIVEWCTWELANAELVNLPSLQTRRSRRVGARRLWRGGFVLIPRRARLRHYRQTRAIPIRLCV